MNVLKICEELVKTRDEIRDIRIKLEAKERKIDTITDELIEFLKYKKIIETRSV